MDGKNRSTAAQAQVDELAARLRGTIAETIYDPDYIVNRAMAHYGYDDGLLVMLRLIEQHISAPQIREGDGFTYTEAFVPGVGPLELFGWPRDSIVEGDVAHLAMGFAADDIN